jgi:Rrf2 family transcriptional regulator, nitric oxide-sensitive transcriptional repressor
VASERAPYRRAVQLTIYTDYALRTLMYLAIHEARPVPVTEIAAAYGISAHHVAKVAKHLVRGGFLRSHRGRTGGLELARAASKINVGDVVRFSEPTLDLLECFDRAISTCPLTGGCRLERKLHEARAAFLAVLDGTTVAGLTENGALLAGRLGGSGLARRDRRTMRRAPARVRG